MPAVAGITAITTGAAATSATTNNAAETTSPAAKAEEVKRAGSSDVDDSKKRKTTTRTASRTLMDRLRAQYEDPASKTTAKAEEKKEIAETPVIPAGMSLRW